MPGFEICFTHGAGTPFLGFASAVNSRRLLAGIYLFLFVAIGLGGGTLFLKSRQEYLLQRQNQEKLGREVADLRARVAAQERYLERLRSDPALLEREIRQRLKYTRPGEWVFDFSE